jgi:hypothetical protein
MSVMKEVALVSAIFALVGTSLGILGTLAVQLIQSRTEDIRARQAALRLAGIDFISAVARTRNLFIELRARPADPGLLESMRDANRSARERFESLRLITSSFEVQKAGRHVVRYNYGLLRQVEGKALRPDEENPELLITLNDWLNGLRSALRRELGVPSPNTLYMSPRTGSILIEGPARELS